LERRITTIISMFAAIMVFSCNKMEQNTAPRVTPEIVSIELHSVTIKWNSVGDDYTYLVLVSLDSVSDNNFHDVALSIDNSTDTICTIDNLLPNTFHKIIVQTNGTNMNSNQSWPPLRFKTE